MEDALRHIYRLAETGDGWVSNTAVATQLDVTRATVSSTFDALATRGLVEREAYRPVRLTEAGETAALDVVRRHRLVETLLVEMFDYAMSEVDVEADRLEHHLSDRLCREIERTLGMPSADPHGDPIPDAALDVEHGDLIPLFDVDEAAVVEVVRILLRDDETLDELVSVGIEPSAVLTLTERTPLGTVVVTVSGTDQQTTLPEAVASAILVESGGG
ncbi:metal-dependent transcriptional regulator [Halogranum rubrum]|nr:metal-dependent transcriptional regulator [Halogranum salarium]